MTYVLEGNEYSRQTASLGFNATLPDAPHGSNLFTHSVLITMGDSGLRSRLHKAVVRLGRLRRYDFVLGEQSRAAAAGRSLQ
jgi:hypothetical protein